MSGKYREKSCKHCGILHRKRGPYCGQSCANRGRESYSQKVADNMRKVSVEYRKSPEGVAHHALFVNGIHLAAEEYAVDIPDFPDLPDGYLTDL